MSTLATFDAFTAARLGIYAAQQGLQVTGNNISNINTAGYTRQRLDQVSFKAGAYDRYRSQLDNHMGSGALVMNINQIRDPYLDVRYRNTNADVGYNETFLKGLNHIASILDEVGVGDDTNVNKKGDGRLQAQIQAVSDALRKYADEPTKLNNDLVRKAADTLCGIINSYATQLENFRKETEEDFKDQVIEVNEILSNIRDLNDEIRDNEIFGDNALELRDERNRQIDKLSELIHIKVVYGEENVGAGRKVEKLSIYLDNDNPDSTVHTDEALLIDGIFGAQLSSPENLLMANPTFDPDSTAAGDPRSYRYIALSTKWGTDEDGNELTYDLAHAEQLTYTNDPERAVKMPNNNYGLQISQLEDENGRLWEGTHTEWTELSEPNAVVGKAAVYQSKITKSENWKAGDTFTLTAPDNTVKTYKIGSETDCHITEEQMNNPAALASFLAKELGEMYSDDYTVSAAGDGTIRFVAKKVGAIGSKGPAAAPLITLGPGNTNATIDPAQPVSIQDGKDEKKPDNPPETGDNPPLNPNGTQTIVSYQLNGGKWYQVTTIKEKTYPLTLDDNDLYGSLQATRELLTEKAEFASEDDVAIDEDAAKKRGIPFYQNYLDLFAYQFATEYNKLNQGYCYNENGNYIDENNQELELAGAPVSKTSGLTDAQKQALIDDGCTKEDENGDTVPDLERWLEAKGAKQPEGVGVLFSNRNDGDLTDDPPIRASNITVSHSWSTGDVQLVPKFEVLWADAEHPDGMNHSTQNTNANHMVTLIDPANNILFNPQSIKSDAISDRLFFGSFNGMYNDMCTTLGEEQKKHTVAANMYSTQLVEIDTAREGVSGVDLNDEAMNLMQYQKAYSAACRLMTVVDEALDRLINNTGIAGR